MGYSVNTTALGKRSYWRIVEIRHGNGGEHGEPKNGTDAGEKEELEFEFESEKTSTAQGKRGRSAATVSEPVSSLAEYRERMVGRITDLDAKLMREMEEVERITSTSRNLKGTYVRRLQQVCCKARAVSAELQLRTIVALRAPASSREIERKKEERERENPRLKESVRYGNERRWSWPSWIILGRTPRPCFGMGGVRGRDTLGPSLHPDGRSYGWSAQDTGARASTGGRMNLLRWGSTHRDEDDMAAVAIVVA